MAVYAGRLCRSGHAMFAFFLEPELIFSSVFRMHEAALEYGIVLKDLAVIDRQFKVKRSIT
jgi:hypothetical protein